MVGIEIIRNHMFFRMRFVTSLFAIFLSLASCGIIDRQPGPESIAAANSIARDLTSHLPYTHLSTNLSDTALSTFALVFDRVRNDYVRPVQDADLLASARKGLRERYPKPQGVSSKKLVMAAIQGMLQSLDKYSTYLDPSELKAIRERIQGQFGGLGIKINKHERGLLVISPIDDTPAFRAGIKSGDVITRADGRALAKMSLPAAVRLLRGEVGDPITLSIVRKGTEPFNVMIIREIIKIKGVHWRIVREVGYIRVSAFTRDVSKRVETAVEKIHSQAGGRLRGFVLDLRSNPGGPFDEAIYLSDAFLESGRIVSTKGRHTEEHHEANIGDIAKGLPMAVMINEGSASASEIVAGSLRDHRRAVLIGKRSFGKGTVQRLIPLGGNDALRLTTSIYLTPSGKSVEGGIEPDTVVESNPDREGDEQLERAIETIRKMFSSH